MKSLRHAWERICSFENLVLAYRQASRGRRNRLDVERFGHVATRAMSFAMRRSRTIEQSLSRYMPARATRRF